MQFTFKVGESIKKAWGLYKENFSQMLILTLIMLAIQFASQSLSKHEGNFLLSVILIIVSVLVSYIWIRAILSLLEGKGFNPFSKESLPSLAQIWDFIKTNILIALCVVPFFIIPVIVIGMTVATTLLANAIITPAEVIKMLIIIVPVFIAFMIPAIYVASRLFPAKYLSVDKYQGSIKNIRDSWDMTKGNGWRIFWKTFLIGLFIMLGFLALVIGMIITLPIGMIVMVMMYKELLKFKVSGGEVNASTVVSEVPVTPATPVMPEVASVNEEVK